jgi:hypothetical protein
MAKRTVTADPTQYSRQSLQSYGAAWIKEYSDIEYRCWRCKKADVFTAEDQKRSFEVKKNYIWQRRNLCRDCWMEANKIRKNLETNQERWASSKTTLKEDLGFLSEWLELLIKLEKYFGYRPDTARKNMLKKLLSKNA